MGEVPALPAQGHGVEGVDMAGIEQVAEEELTVQQGEAQIEARHEADGIRNSLGLAVIIGGIQANGHHHKQAHGIQHPGGGEAGQVFLEDRGIKE